MIGRVKEAPVDAEIRTSVSNAFHVGRFPKGPVIRVVIVARLEAACRFNLRVKPERAHIVSSILRELFWSPFSKTFEIVNGCSSRGPNRGHQMKTC